MSRRQSGLQKEVFALMRQLLRAARKKDPNNEHQLQRFVAVEFRAKAHSVGRMDFTKIEHLIRHGQKQKKLIEMPGFSAASVVRFPGHSAEAAQSNEKR